MGFAVLVLLVPGLGYYGWTGFATARDPAVSQRDRAVGYGLAVTATVALLAGMSLVIRWLLK